MGELKDIVDFCRNLQVKISAAVPETRLNILADEIALFFDVVGHDVGIFKLDRGSHNALFAWPPNRTNQEIKVPLNFYKSSFVSTTAKNGHGSIDNNFSSSPHLHVFEHILTDKEQCIPIQKVMTAPGRNEGKICWIIQVTRKGKTLADSGPDFTSEQLKALEIISQFVVGLPM